jgi:hypothetical protein
MEDTEDEPEAAEAEMDRCVVVASFFVGIAL